MVVQQKVIGYSQQAVKKVSHAKLSQLKNQLVVLTNQIAQNNLEKLRKA